MLDDTNPVIEFTELKDSQDRVIWQAGQEYFDVPEDGIVKVHGLCKEEYLPADTYINIGFRKSGKIEINWITEVDKMYNFNPPGTWQDDTEFLSKGLYSDWVCSNNNIKRLGQIDYGLWEVELPWTGTGLDFTKIGNFDISDIRGIFQDYGQVIRHIDYSGNIPNWMETSEGSQIYYYSGDYSATFFEGTIDIAPYLAAGEPNLFGFLYTSESVEPPYGPTKSMGGSNYSYRGINGSSEILEPDNFSILAQTPEQGIKLDILRTVSATGLNITAIGIVQPSEVPQMQIRGNMTVNKGESTQMNTVGVFPITWSVSDGTKATIDSSGILTGVEAGTVDVNTIDAIGQTATKQITIN